MNSNYYESAFDYEMLVRHAFDCPRGMKNGADLCFMKNAMTMENGETFAKHLGSFQKQFDVVKKYTYKALIKLSKTKPYNQSATFFEDRQKKLDNVKTTKELMKIVKEALNKVIEHKNN